MKLIKVAAEISAATFYFWLIVLICENFRYPVKNLNMMLRLYTPAIYFGNELV